MSEVKSYMDLELTRNDGAPAKDGTPAKDGASIRDGAPAALKPRGGNMAVRWITAGVGIPLFVGVCFLGWFPFTIAIICLSVLGLAEMLTTYYRQGFRPNILLAMIGLFGPAWTFVTTRAIQDTCVGIMLAMVLLTLVWEVLWAARTGKKEAASNTAYGLLCAMYSALFGGLTALRKWPGEVDGGPFHGVSIGLMLVIVAACCVWATDSAALFAGKVAGRRKLAPLLSPAKTVEGAVGGLVGGLFIGALFGWIFLHAPVFGLAVGAAAGIFGQVGDLFESALKREVGVKDFGAIIPGHGGVLDRFDSLLIVAPLVWLMVWLHRGV